MALSGSPVDAAVSTSAPAPHRPPNPVRLTAAQFSMRPTPPSAPPVVHIRSVVDRPRGDLACSTPVPVAQSQGAVLRRDALPGGVTVRPAMARKVRPKPVLIQSAKRRALTYRRWVRWWRVLFNDIKTIAHHRDLYRQVTAMIDAKPALQVPSACYDWMQLVYVTSQASAIRRLVDWDRRSISLVRLIEEIADHPEVLSRRRFVGLYRGHLPSAFGHRHFQRIARPGADLVDRRLIRRHRRELLTAHRRLRTFVNKYVAHRDKRPMRHLPTYADLDRCVDVVERLGKEYSFILKAEGTSVVPAIMGDWKKPFRVAWL